MRVDQRKHTIPVLVRAGLLLAALLASGFRPMEAVQPDTSPPSEPVRLIFIHHSTGENWLRDDYGGLGLALAENNYFVSDTNYGWGPDAIGDRTDIPDWLEWFASEGTPGIMQAVYTESDRHADYSRLFPDPGGENTIVLFKSCFPNSALEGSPDDPPDPEGWLTVGHAKYVYNQILTYFASRPDKLFIVITAPPLSDRTYADNARAFNDWLVDDWLAGNGYTLPNVAVFDFYNVLTARDAHHRVAGGTIEHIATGRDTLFYPSGDDHPSEAGSRKATEEFLPLLNYFYQRWASDPASSAPVAPAATADPATGPSTAPDEPTAVPSGSEAFADFDLTTPALNAYWDEQTATRIACAPADDFAFSGSTALKIDFSVPPGTWSTCVLEPAFPPVWEQGQGLRYALHASRAGIPYEIVLYAGTADALESYIDYAEIPQDSVQGWAVIELPWSEFHRVDWEEDGGQAFASPQEILSVGFGFSAGEQEIAGTVWVDDLALLEQGDPGTDAGTPVSDPNLCALLVLFPLTLTAGMVLLRRKGS